MLYKILKRHKTETAVVNAPHEILTPVYIKLIYNYITLKVWPMKVDPENIVYVFNFLMHVPNDHELFELVQFLSLPIRTIYFDESEFSFVGPDFKLCHI